MQIFNKVAGFSLGEADVLRRALSKKKVAEFEKYMPQFIDGMVKAGTTKQQAEDYWDELLEFANYA